MLGLNILYILAIYGFPLYHDYTALFIAMCISQSVANAGN